MSSSSSSGGSSSPAPPAPGQPQPQAVPIEVDSGSSSSGNSSSSSSSSSSSAGEADEEDEEELTAPKWSAPKGFQLSSASANTAFDWDAIANDPNLELWLFKTPEGIKGRHMTDVILPEASTSQSTQPIASFQAKKSGFEIVHVPTPAGQDAETEAPQISAEMSRLHPLLPHDGKMQLSKKSISRHYIVQHESVKPAPPPERLQQDAAASDEDEVQMRKRHKQPASILKARNQFGNANTFETSAPLAVPASSHKGSKKDKKRAEAEDGVDSAAPKKKKRKDKGQ